MESYPIQLEDSFVKRSHKSGKFISYYVKLSSSGIQINEKVNDSKIRQEFIDINDIISCKCQRKQLLIDKHCHLFQSDPCILIDNTMDNVDTSDRSAYLTIISYVKHSQESKRHRLAITLRFLKYDNYKQNFNDAIHWTNIVHNLKRQNNPFYQFDIIYKYLIILNPNSGQGQGRDLFKKFVRKILEEAKIDYDLQITKYANFGRSLIRSKDLSKYHSIVIVGGDGILFEVINGIFERVDWLEILNNIPIGIVPSGSGNGVIKSICYQFHELYNPQSVLGPILTLVHHKKHPIDLVRVEIRSKTMFSLLSVGWGFLSDIDIESERLRKLGSKRFTIWSLIRLINLKLYKGRIWYLPIERKQTEVSKPLPPDSNNFSEITLNYRKLSRLESWHSTKSFLSTTNTDYGSVIENEIDLKQNQPIYGPQSNIPPLLTPLDSQLHWEKIEDEFIMAHASYQSHLSTDCNFIPNAIMNEGIIWLMVLRKGLRKSQVMNFLMSLKHGTHLDLISKSNLIQLIKCKAFRFEPEDNCGNITVDGEFVDYGPIQAEIFSDLVQVLVP